MQVPFLYICDLFFYINVIDLAFILSSQLLAQLEVTRRLFDLILARYRRLLFADLGLL